MGSRNWTLTHKGFVRIHARETWAGFGSYNQKDRMIYVPDIMIQILILQFIPILFQGYDLASGGPFLIWNVAIWIIHYKILKCIWLLLVSGFHWENHLWWLVGTWSSCKICSPTSVCWFSTFSAYRSDWFNGCQWDCFDIQKKIESFRHPFQQTWIFSTIHIYIWLHLSSKLHICPKFTIFGFYRD